MKELKILFLAAVCTASSAVFAIEVPQQVQAAFDKVCPDVADEAWSADEGYYVATFNQNQFEASIEAYTLVVQSKPMDERSILGIGKMIRAANKLSLTIESEDDRLYYKILESTFIGHLAEYYNYNAHGNTLIIEAAGNELLSLAQYYRDSNLVAQADEVQQLYYKNYVKSSM